MAVNRDKPDRWKDDIARSGDMYNNWFMRFAPEAYRTTRVQTTKDVAATLKATKNITDIGVELLRATPTVLPTLRMSTCPPLAVDGLIGLAGISPNLIKVMEKQGKLPPRMSQQALDTDLEKIGQTVREMADPDIFVWLGRRQESPHGSRCIGPRRPWLIVYAVRWRIRSFATPKRSANLQWSTTGSRQEATRTSPPETV